MSTVFVLKIFVVYDNLTHVQFHTTHVRMLKISRVFNFHSV